MIKRLPDDVSREIIEVYKAKAPIILAHQRAQSPSRRVANGLSFKIAEKGLRLRIGLIGKRINRVLFFARILEGGRKAQTVTVKRFREGGGRSIYSLRVKAISRATYDFVFGRSATFALAQLRPELKLVYERALRRAAGVTD